MAQSDERGREIAELRHRLSRLSEASLHINESLDVDTALRAVMDSARSITDSRYAVIVTLDDAGRVEDHLVAGLNSGDEDSVVDRSSRSFPHRSLPSVMANYIHCARLAAY